MGAGISSDSAVSEKGRAHSDDGGPFFNGHFKIMTHAHGKMTEIQFGELIPPSFPPDL
jgi:hypothetical protein